MIKIKKLVKEDETRQQKQEFYQSLEQFINISNQQIDKFIQYLKESSKEKLKQNQEEKRIIRIVSLSKNLSKEQFLKIIQIIRSYSNNTFYQITQSLIFNSLSKKFTKVIAFKCKQRIEYLIQINLFNGRIMVDSLRINFYYYSYQTFERIKFNQVLEKLDLNGNNLFGVLVDHQYKKSYLKYFWKHNLITDQMIDQYLNK